VKTISIAILSAWFLTVLAAACASPAPPQPVNVTVQPAPVTVGPATTVIVQVPSAAAPAPTAASPVDAGAEGGRRRYGAAAVPGIGQPVTILDPTGSFAASVTDAGALVTTATLTGTVTVGSITGTVDAGATINAVAAGVQACTPTQFYAANAGVLVDAGSHYFYSGSCFNRGATAQYVQLQVTSTGPLPDAGPACLQWYIPASNSEIFLDPRSPGGVNMTQCAGLAPGAISFDVSGSTQFYVPDAGNVDCNFCWL
jgi:hypothetical protein